MRRCCVSPTFRLMFRSRSIKFAVCQPPWNRVVRAKERFNAKNCCEYWSMCNQCFSLLLLLLLLICMIWLWLLLVKHTPLHWFTKLIRFDAFICFMHLHGLAFHVEYIWRCMRAPTHDLFETKAKRSSWGRLRDTPINLLWMNSAIADRGSSARSIRFHFNSWIQKQKKRNG